MASREQELEDFKTLFNLSEIESAFNAVERSDIASQVPPLPPRRRIGTTSYGLL